jgi:uncharacterized protein DUF4232
VRGLQIRVVSPAKQAHGFFVEVIDALQRQTQVDGAADGLAAIEQPAARFRATALASSGSAAQASHRAATCAAAKTRVWYGEPVGVAAGHSYLEVQLSNIGRSTCSFFGYPGVSALKSSGTEVGKPARHTGTKITVTLAPGATAHFVVTVTDASLICAHPVRATQIRVFPPGQFHAQIVPLVTEQCVGRSVMSVDAVHSRAGIPGFSAT